MKRSHSGLVVCLTCVLLGPAGAQPRRDRVRYDLERVTLYFQADRLSSADMEGFARLVDQGVRDVESYLTRDAAGVRLSRERITIYISDRVRIARTWGDRVALPMRRVENRSAPYLHEVAHALVPGRNREIWLNEGFASYVESWVVENIGGYAAHVFSREGNRGIDRDAARHLLSRYGRDALPYIGRSGAPPGFDHDRERVAPPVYVLAHSFFKYLVDQAGLGCAVRLLDSDASAVALEERTGRSLDAWKADWLLAIGALPRVGD